MTRLVEAGLIAEDYKDTEYNGGTQNSVVVIGVRPGNPENIDSWDDLVSGDIEVITPNPFTSGGARWNLMAAYGSQIAQGKSEDEALDFVAQILEHTPVQDASARDSLQTFIGGKGDVFLSYENEALGAIDGRRGARVHRPRRDDPDRDPDGRDHRGRRPGGRAGVHRLPAHRRGPARSGPRSATARSTRRSSPSTRTSSRSRRSSSRSRSSAAGRRSRPSSSIRPRARWRRSSAISGWRRSESRGRHHC